MFERDFTLKMYKTLCNSIISSGYDTPSLSDYLANKNYYNDAMFIIIRHDIDNKVDLPIAQKMADYEQSIGIKASYYFRMVDDTFDRDIIIEIASKGHEIGYHYEVLNQSNGNVELGFNLLRKNLEIFREIVPVNTICQHGGSLGEDTASTFFGLVKTALKVITGKMKVKNFESNRIWGNKRFGEFDLLGEAYLSLDWKKIIYVSDTGIRWDGYKNRILDFVEADYYLQEKVIASDTNKLIELITENRYPRLNILVHPANWIDPLFSWCKWRLLQYFRNIGKNIILTKQLASKNY